jgi:hypothetical protein
LELGREPLGAGSYLGRAAGIAANAWQAQKLEVPGKIALTTGVKRLLCRIVH